MSNSQIEAKIIAYAALHVPTLVADCKTMYTAFDANQFTTVGVDACQVA